MEHVDDNIPVSGYIDKEKLLAYVSEEEIFELVFGFKPEEYQYVCSPFRKDSNPGCWFERSQLSDKLEFIDYADPFHNKQDCFTCVKRFFNLSNFYQTLLFIKRSLIEKRGITKVRDIEEERKNFVPTPRKGVEIYVKPRNYIQSDKTFWYRYGITRTQLASDKVIPVGKFALLGSKKGDITSIVYTNCYAYTEFEGNRKKLYFPYKTGKGRFITNCTQNDIGSVLHLKDSTQLVITKSYKDCRVLRNEGTNCVWFQNEGMIPDDSILLKLVSPYSDIPVFYDNDSTGLLAGKKIVEKINSLKPGVARRVTLPISLLAEKIKDASDMYCMKGKEDLREFLKSKKIQCQETLWIQAGIPY